MRKTRALIFDMDGVLVDSMPYIRSAFRTLFKQSGIPLSELRQPSGASMQQLVARWNPSYRLSLTVDCCVGIVDTIHIQQIEKDLKCDPQQPAFLDLRVGLEAWSCDFLHALDSLEYSLDS